MGTAKGRLCGIAAVLASALALSGCDNNPYADNSVDRKVIYTTFVQAPRTLDPAVAYTTAANAIVSAVYDPLLQYHFLKRPYELIGALATEVPRAELRDDGGTTYVFRLRQGLHFAEDESFGAFTDGIVTREVTARDAMFALQRLADPVVGSPVISNFEKIEGFVEFSERLQKAGLADAEFSEMHADMRYEQVGPIEGIEYLDDYSFALHLSEPYPQILYWFAMGFTAPLPWEAVAYYDGEEGRPHFKDHPVGTGPFVLSTYEKQHKMVLTRNERWYGIEHPEWQAPAATYPMTGSADDAENGMLDAEYVGRALPFIDEVQFLREKEAIPAFGKFLQGYYDVSGIIDESFDQIVRNDALSPEMAATGMRLLKSVGPSIFYIGFNMDDAVVGRDGRDSARKVRQAMSLVIDSEEFSRLFLNGRGIPAQSAVAPSLYGYEADYVNPYRVIDVEKARALLSEAGYENGVDPETSEPLTLSFDTYRTTSQGLLQAQFYVDAWAELGIRVKIAATNYNQFQEKVRRGAYQIFEWGWIADYPDPENFLFLFQTAMSRTASGGPNTANFSDPEFDRMFAEMKGAENTPARYQLVRDMIDLLEYERPWIELYHRELYTLAQPWVKNIKPSGMSFSTYKYRDIDPLMRAELREEWNEPVLWPLVVAAIIGLGIIIPGVTTYMRERQ